MDAIEREILDTLCADPDMSIKALTSALDEEFAVVKAGCENLLDAGLIEVRSSSHYFSLYGPTDRGRERVEKRE